MPKSHVCARVHLRACVRAQVENMVPEKGKRACMQWCGVCVILRLRACIHACVYTCSTPVHLVAGGRQGKGTRAQWGGKGGGVGGGQYT
jgi:hypothetical protein